ncbi:MAG: ABC transporter permease [Bacteroidetes bacterium]|nr:ABC transporter permease [Bacteroidota bacterium]
MNTELFIARKIISGRERSNRLTKPIVVISLISIILGIAFMIVSVAVVTGFQNGIREKVIGFGAHIQVTNFDENSSMESSPVLMEQLFYPELNEDPRVKNIQVYAFKPAILQSRQDSVKIQLANNKDTVESRQDILGVRFKGVDAGYDWSFFEDKLVDGRILDFSSENDEVLISKYMADMLGYKVGEELDAFFIHDDTGPKKRKFTVCGIYRTGFEEFDKQFIYTQLHHLQLLNNWGVQTNLTVLDTCIGDYFVLQAKTHHGTGAYRYDWGNGYKENSYYLFTGELNDKIRLVSTDFELEIYGLSPNPKSLPDTATAKIVVEQSCTCSEELLKQKPIRYLSENEIQMPFGKLKIENGKGSHGYYVGGFEIILKNWSDLAEMDDIIYNEIPVDMKTTKITAVYPEIFKWLKFLNIDIIIILVLILLVSVINMVTTLLVMILEKTNMIGILKALGATDASIRKVFIYNAFYLLSRGLIIGNILGIGLVILQQQTGFVSLNPDIYYLDTVPVNFNLWHILLINLLTIVVCFLTLLLPGTIITRISPVKAIRFN